MFIDKDNAFLDKLSDNTLNVKLRQYFFRMEKTTMTGEFKHNVSDVFSCVFSSELYFYLFLHYALEDQIKET